MNETISKPLSSGSLRIAAGWSSYVFHPLLFPAYGTFFLILSHPHLFTGAGYKVPLLWNMVVFILTFVFPAVWLGMMKALGLIPDLYLRNKKERIIPYIATATFYLWTYRMFRPGVGNLLFQSQLISSMMLGASVSISLAFIANIFMKVSLHSVGVGSFVGLLMSVMAYSEYDLRILLVLALLLGGWVGSSRLLLGEHEQREVYYGYLAGFAGQFVSFKIIPTITNYF